MTSTSISLKVLIPMWCSSVINNTKSLKVKGDTSMFLTKFIKGNNPLWLPVCFQAQGSPPKWGFTLRERICCQRSKSFLSVLVPNEKGGKNEYGRVVSSERVSLHFTRTVDEVTSSRHN